MGNVGLKIPSQHEGVFAEVPHCQVQEEYQDCQPVQGQESQCMGPSQDQVCAQYGVSSQVSQCVIEVRFLYVAVGQTEKRGCLVQRRSGCCIKYTYSSQFNHVFSGCCRIIGAFLDKSNKGGLLQEILTVLYSHSHMAN